MSSRPFARLLEPLVRLACSQTKAKVESLGNLLAPTIPEDLRQQIEAQIFSVAQTTLYHEFTRSRPIGVHLTNRLQPGLYSTEKAVQYERFLEHGLTPVLDQYPVLATLLETVVADWVAGQARFLSRLETDFPSLLEFVGSTEEEHTGVESFEFLDTLPNAGRQLCIITFRSGRRVVYKPRDVGPDDQFSRFLDWHAEHHPGTRLRGCRHLVRDGYGWAEFVPFVTWEDIDSELFLHKAGALTAALYLLRGTDCHRENVIASGNDPVLIDLETLFHQECLPTTRFGMPPSTSLLRTHMLAEIEGARALAGLALVDPVSPKRLWNSIGTDALHYEIKLVKRQRRHLPCLLPKEIGPYLARGFEEMYRFICRRKEDVLHPDGPLGKASRSTSRFVLRGSGFYRRLLTKLQTPEILASKAKTERLLDSLETGFDEEQKRKFQPLLNSERRALKRVAVPRFQSAVDGTALSDSEGTFRLESFFQESGWTLLEKQLSRANERDLDYQLGILHRAASKMDLE